MSKHGEGKIRFDYKLLVLIKSITQFHFGEYDEIHIYHRDHIFHSIWTVGN